MDDTKRLIEEIKKQLSEMSVDERKIQADFLQ